MAPARRPALPGLTSVPRIIPADDLLDADIVHPAQEQRQQKEPDDPQFDDDEGYHLTPPRCEERT